MCPPQASTGVSDAAVKPILMVVELSPSYEPIRLYAVTLVIVPLNIVKTWFQRPSSRLGWGRVTWGSGGMGNVVGEPHPGTSEQGSFPTISLRLYEVR